MNQIPRVEIIGVTGLPEMVGGERLGGMIAAAARAQGTPLEDGDVVVVTQKIVSKAEGRLVDLGSVQPSALARHFADATGKDARLVELVLRESRAVVRMDADRGLSYPKRGMGLCAPTRGLTPLMCRGMMWFACCRRIRTRRRGAYGLR